MRSAPIDTGRLQLLGTGKVAPKLDYNDQNRRQLVDSDTGMFVWTIDAFIDDDEAKRAEVIGITVAAAEEPVTEKFKPITGLRDVTARFYVDGGGRLGTTLSAKYDAPKPFGKADKGDLGVAS